jgi:MFS family permease
VYQIGNIRQVLRSRPGAGGVRWPARTVVLLGLTSMFTDISSEMVNAILPIYLVATLGLTPLAFGLIDGIYQGGSVLVRPLSGFLADRTRSPKLVATAGYALSALTRPAFLVVQGATALTGLIVIDRVGKGIRTAPRDALISLSSKPGELGVAFGVHRALDTLGAMVGPLLAFAILLAIPNAFDVVFVVSFSVALIGLAVIGLFVRDVPVDEASTSALRPALSVRDALGVLRTPGFRVLILVGSGLALLTISDAFIYLILQRRFDFGIQFFPLLFVGTAFAYMVLAVPFGRLADRYGRGRVFIAGYAVLALVYVSLLVPALGHAQVLVSIALLGAYYAMTDGVLAALASGLLPEAVRGTGLGVLASATNLMRLFASVLFGLAWTVWDVSGAVVVFLAGLVAAAAVGAGLLAGQARVRSNA